MATGSRGMYTGVLRGGLVEVRGQKNALEIFENGFFGKGTLSRSRPLNLGKENLILLHEEAYFLSFYVKCLSICTPSEDGKKILEKQLAKEECFNVFSHFNPRFPERYATYHYYRSRGWIIRSGLKFGADFLFYKDSPEKVHASFCVVVENLKETKEGMISTFASLERLCTIAGNAAKSLLVCMVSVPDDEKLQYLDAYSILGVELTRWFPRRPR
ncbi:hypothetical protein AAMO2058_001411900 [Amorphochlora amoebiformis]